jgi:hypothetical protein
MVLADILTDVKESRYFQIWLVLWLVGIIVFFVAFGNITSASSLQAADPLFHAWRILDLDISGTGLIFPDFFARTVDPLVTFKTLDCSSDEEKPLTTTKVAACPDGVKGHSCFVISGSQFRAFPTSNAINCVGILDGIYSPNGTKIRQSDQVWGVVWTGAFSRSAELVDISDNVIAEIEISPHQYLVQGNGQYQVPTQEWILWNPDATQIPQTGDNSAVAVVISVEEFVLRVFKSFDPYGGWQGYADLGGALFMSYVMQKILMFLVAFVVVNDSRTLGGARSSYDNVQGQL